MALGQDEDMSVLNDFTFVENEGEEVVETDVELERAKEKMYVEKKRVKDITKNKAIRQAKMDTKEVTK